MFDSGGSSRAASASTLEGYICIEIIDDFYFVSHTVSHIRF
jgi:hypothetical protein